MDENQVIRLLREKEITPTNQRVKIASVIFARPQHFSADQLLEEVNRQGRIASKATIYNTLELFVSNGLIKQLIVDPTRVYYDSSVHHHYHYFDPDTQELHDIDPAEVDVILPHNLPAGKSIADVNLVIQLKSCNA